MRWQCRGETLLPPTLTVLQEVDPAMHLTVPRPQPAGQRGDAEREALLWAASAPRDFEMSRG